jgi:TetR/AcrR family transcriptional regulator, cholesterol catabolism regulator
MQATSDHIPRRQEEVVDVATAIFFTRGYRASPLTAVADELGIGKSSLYHYIRSKQDLLVAICDRVHHDIEQILDDVIAEPDLSALSRIERYVRAQISYSLAHWKRMTVYHDEMGHLKGGARKSVVERSREHRYVIRMLVRDAQREGSVALDVDPELLTDCLFAVVASAYRWVRPAAGLTSETVASEVTRFVIRGMTSP